MFGINPTGGDILVNSVNRQDDDIPPAAEEQQLPQGIVIQGLLGNREISGEEQVAVKAMMASAFQEGEVLVFHYGLDFDPAVSKMSAEDLFGGRPDFHDAEDFLQKLTVDKSGKATKNKLFLVHDANASEHLVVHLHLGSGKKSLEANTKLLNGIAASLVAVSRIDRFVSISILGDVNINTFSAEGDENLQALAKSMDHVIMSSPHGMCILREDDISSNNQACLKTEGNEERETMFQSMPFPADLSKKQQEEYVSLLKQKNQSLSITFPEKYGYRNHRPERKVFLAFSNDPSTLGPIDNPDMNLSLKDHLNVGVMWLVPVQTGDGEYHFSELFPMTTSNLGDIPNGQTGHVQNRHSHPLPEGAGVKATVSTRKHMINLCQELTKLGLFTPEEGFMEKDASQISGGHLKKDAQYACSLQFADPVLIRGQEYSREEFCQKIGCYLQSIREGVLSELDPEAHEIVSTIIKGVRELIEEFDKLGFVEHLKEFEEYERSGFEKKETSVSRAAFIEQLAEHLVYRSSGSKGKGILQEMLRPEKLSLDYIPNTVSSRLTGGHTSGQLTGIPTDAKPEDIVLHQIVGERQNTVGGKRASLVFAAEATKVKDTILGL
ncbi:MAG: hypothetical protein ACI9S8_000668 [Chlamydiales bacterium]|jgi:hypothetical protein